MNRGLLILFFIVALVLIKTIPEIIRRIRIHRREWDISTKKRIINRHVDLGMNYDMVSLSWGSPSNIDNIEMYVGGYNERWVYGQKRKNANYVYFMNDKVTRIVINGPQ